MIKKIKLNNSGITLVVLAVTSIVLLILAGTSISILSREDSIIQKATIAKNSTEMVIEKEQLEIEVLGSYNGNGKLEIDKVKFNINNNLRGVTTSETRGFPLTVTYIATENSYSVDRNGIVTRIEE